LEVSLKVRLVLSDYVTMKMKASQVFETSGNTQRHSVTPQKSRIVS